jgi:ATP-dependent helicase HrpB
VELQRLPIESVLPEIQAVLEHASVAVIQAPPGAGKSTVLPLALLNAPWLQDRRIIMLEPRRLAARAVATWMALTLGEPVGRTVGYRTRLKTRVGRDTRLEVVTEGILTRMLQNDPALEGVGCVIFDEFHERSLHADLGLALCLDAQAMLHEDLRLIVMSATLDADAIAAFLNNAAVIVAEGRSFPVETRLFPQMTGARLEIDVTACVRRALRDDEGDMLVFLPGVGEIMRVQRLLEQADLGAGVRVVPLHGDLSFDKQEQAIQPSVAGCRKIVLATSIAETSLTIEGVRIVIDSGLARRAEFNPQSGMTRLVTTRVSRAAADQRRGRAGRLGPGICYRLWTEAADQRLTPFAPPEIMQADLCALALELASWGVADPVQLRWLTPPPAASFAQARALLAELGALDREGRVNAHGRAMNQLGLHPRLAHMLIKAQALGLARLACDLAAILSERDILRAPPEARHADLRLRIEALRHGRTHLPAKVVIDRGAVERARNLPQSWHAQLKPLKEQSVIPEKMTDEEDVGLLLAFAYPDRIARARPGGGRYLLSNGRGAAFAGVDTLAREPYLVIADLDAGEREGRIYLAAPITLTQLETHFADQIETRDTVAWDTRTEAVIARREQRLGELTISEAMLEQPDPALITGAVLEGIGALGLSVLPWDRETRTWQARVQFLRKPDPADWPDVSDAQLLATRDAWLAPYLSSVTRRDQFARVDLKAALRALLTWEQQRRLDEEAPTHLAVPSGSRIALDYTHEEAPVLAARLQELFGLHETPRIARGRVPVLIQILSPAQRPVQVTRDLASFWAKGYHDVKKDLKGRYPKHYWPDNPLTATATRRVRPETG